MQKDPALGPVLKWVGGKRQLLAEIEQHLPPSFSTYYEPFLGGGAVLFHLQPARAVVNDINAELINVYEVIRSDCPGLLADLKKHHNEAEYFYSLRAKDRDREQYAALNPVQRASRILYLNKTCYNGLFRVNRSGQFNVPFGRYKNPNIVNEKRIRAAHRYFNRARLTFLCGDFAAAVRGSKAGDFVYFDPPYDPVSASANFTAYVRHGFDRQQQLRLKELCDQLSRRGVKFLLSNSATAFILDLYRDYDVNTVRARRAVNTKADQRGFVDEVLIKNY